MSEVVKELPSIHQPVSIIVNAGSPSEYRIKSVFDSEDEKDRLKLRLLESVNKQLVANDKIVILEFTRADALYHIEGPLLSVYTQKDPTFISELTFAIVQPNYPVRRIQRRNFFRLPIKLSVRFKTVTLPEGFDTSRDVRKHSIANWKAEKSPFTIGTTFDLSGGGLAMSSPVGLNKGDRLFLEFSLADTLFQVVAEATLIKPNQKNDASSCIVGLQFLSIDPKEQDFIVQYIFRSQKKPGQKEKS